ncbi:MAG: redox-regulated ATPase YchF [Candidatus Omnitrophica bacterium]|nr:redox-regulated ATPase YchF [Candidatus Omnitrophota bacterium]
MKIGIIGLPQSGKKKLFELLTSHRINEKDLASGKPLLGIAEIRDPRFDKLVDIYKPNKHVKAKINIEVLPKIEQDSVKKGSIFRDIADTDAMCHVVRKFKDESVYHVHGSVDPERDINEVNSELILNDLIFVEKRLENLEKNIRKTSDKDLEREKVLLLKFKESLDKEIPLRLLKVPDEDRKLIASYPLVTRKEMVVALNVSDDEINDASYVKKMQDRYKDQGIKIMQVSAKVEAEIAELATIEEKKEFMGALGIEEPAIDKLTRLCLEALDLMSFFTVGKDEVRQWTIRKGSLAPEAAGAIHSDLQRGFIRAEVIKYADMIEYQTEEKVKQVGKLDIKGKDYTVQDGDIMNIRFSV